MKRKWLILSDIQIIRIQNRSVKYIIIQEDAIKNIIKKLDYQIRKDTCFKNKIGNISVALKEKYNHNYIIIYLVLSNVFYIRQTFFYILLIASQHSQV